MITTTYHQLTQKDAHYVILPRERLGFVMPTCCVQFQIVVGKLFKLCEMNMINCIVHMERITIK